MLLSTSIFFEEHRFTSSWICSLVFVVTCCAWWNKASSASPQAILLTVLQLLHQTTCPILPAPTKSTKSWLSYARAFSSWSSWCPTVVSIGAHQHSQKTRLTWWQECKQGSHLGHTVDHMPCNNKASTHRVSPIEPPEGHSCRSSPDLQNTCRLSEQTSHAPKRSERVRNCCTVEQLDWEQCKGF